MAVPVLRGTSSTEHEYGVSLIYSLDPYATHKSFDDLSHGPRPRATWTSQFGYLSESSFRENVQWIVKPCFM